MEPLTRVRQIARYFRGWAEENIEELGFGDDDCGGMCAHASYEIFDALRIEGFSVQFCRNHQHCFVLWFDAKGMTYLIDVTATQFRRYLPKVIVRPYHHRPKLWKGDSPWEIEHRANTPDEVAEILEAWPDEQKPLQFQRIPTA